jgi:error-prone DNA polymerase
MPEQPEPKHLAFHRPATAPTECIAPRIPYAELHCATNFSFLEGASHGEELAAQAAALGYAALAITDRNSLAGVVRAHVAAKEAGLKLLIGALITPTDAPAVLLWATDRAAYGRLSRLISLGRRSAPKGESRLTFDDIANHSEGLLAGVLLSGGREPPEKSSELRGLTPPAQKLTPPAQIEDYRSAFPDRCYAVAEIHRGPADRERLREMMQIAREARLPLVAANDVHYHAPFRRPLHDVLTAVRHGCTVAELGEHRFANAERHLKSPAEMRELFADCPVAVVRTVEIADRCNFSLDELRYDYPEELSPPGMTPLEYLTQLTWEGAKDRYPAGIPDKVRSLIEHELVLISELRYEAYFLTVWDLVRFARGRDILCQGRGSAANSAVCYCLGVTSVDPDRIDVLFERFVSKERNEAPDIDVDFEHERREEVIQYVYEKYGRERAGMTAEVISYRTRSAVRDIGKALGLSLDRVDRLAGALDHYGRGTQDQLAPRLREAGLDPNSRLARQLLWLVEQLLGFPRHLSQHVGGMVITHGPLCELVPIENAAMADRTVIEWDKDDLDALGILKVDCLALGMLTAIRKGFDLIADSALGSEDSASRLNKLTLATVPAEDPVVYGMIGRADTVGVFQIESRAQMSMLPRLKPKTFYDLVIEVAIVRPGPIQGKMVHPYLRRRCGQEQVEYPNEAIRRVLGKTLGVPIFQEQAMQLVVVAAGFTPGEADKLRRAMGAWRRRGIMDQFRDKLLSGMAANGYAAEFAERVYQQICGFGEYGFPESHAASFALLVYVSAWMKCYHPAAFCAAIINSQPMGFYAPAQLVADAKKHGVEVRPVDVNHSEWNCTLEPNTRAEGINPLRLGFRLIRGFRETQAEAIVAARGDRPFGSFEEFARRTGLSSAVLKRLGQADAFGSLAVDRRTALWRALPQREPPNLFSAAQFEEVPAALPEMAPYSEVLADYRTAGLTLRQHPISFLRDALNKLKITPAVRLQSVRNGKWLRVAGVVLMRQRPSTAKGITFVTLEDETGIVNLIVRPNVWERHHRVARTAIAMIAHGRLQHEHGVIHVLVSRLEDLSESVAELEASVRNFH